MMLRRLHVQEVRPEQEEKHAMSHEMLSFSTKQIYLKVWLGLMKTYLHDC